MQCCSNSLTLSSFDHFLTSLIVIISVAFVIYLSAMFILSAVTRYPSQQISVSVLCSLPSPLPSPLPVRVQDMIRPFKRPLTHLTIRQLKQRAKEARIPKYSRMLKPQLIAALQVI
jgi:hypothetical protein